MFLTGETTVLCVGSGSDVVVVYGVPDGVPTRFPPFPWTLRGPRGPPTRDCHLFGGSPSVEVDSRVSGVEKRGPDRDELRVTGGCGTGSQGEKHPRMGGHAESWGRDCVGP